MRILSVTTRSIVIALLFLAGAVEVSAQDLGDLLRRTTERTVSVSGEGVARAAPDEATIRFGVVTQAADPEEARRQNAEAASSAMNAVREMDISDRRIRLETLRLEPIREYDERRRTSDIVGYEAVRIVRVELDDLEQLPSLVARVVERGANRLIGIEYDLSDRRQVRNEALEEALQEARSKAELMAASLDEELGRVIRIDEQGVDMPRPLMETSFRGMEQADAAAPEPDAYAAGEIEVRARVQVTFELR